MKRLQLFKSASDFAYANVGTTNAITLQEAALAAFVAAGFDQADLDYFLATARQQRQVYLQLNAQPAPSAAIAAKAATAQPAAAKPAAAAPAA